MKRTRRTATKDKAKSIFHTGDDLDQKISTIVSQKASGGSAKLNRFFLKMGEEAEVVFLDDNLKDGFGFYEHRLQNEQGYWNKYEVCPKEGSVCPICEHYGESYFVVYFSVMVPDAYTDKQGQSRNVRKLLGIKHSQWQDLKKILIVAQKKNGGNLRGISLVMRREKAAVATQSAAIGSPQIDEESGQMFDIYTEEELVETFGHDEILSEDGKTVFKEENQDIKPFDYSELFKEPDVEQLRKDYGSTLEGSAEQAAEEWDESGGDLEDEPAPEPKAKRKKRSRVSRIVDEDDEGENEFKE